MAIRLKGLATFTDAFVICSGTQRRQTQAICDAVIESLRAEGERPGHVEGYARGDWILIDLFDLVVHVFTPETREFYNLERLWGDAPRVERAADGGGARSGRGARTSSRRTPAKPRKARKTRAASLRKG